MEKAMLGKILGDTLKSLPFLGTSLLSYLIGGSNPACGQALKDQMKEILRLPWSFKCS